ncbi:MAG TPA: glycosyltransferase family 4 protein [Pyrinomonadaceae bacterium]|jgi:glycosyltransferase involved in cell wall biosynthesis
MRVGLVIYGSLETLTGGYLYDRALVNYLKARGDEVEVISLPWRTYGRHLTDNLSSSLRRRLQNAEFDLLIQDELNHPSLFLINRLLKKRIAYPIVTIVHLLRASESRLSWLNRMYGALEQQYLKTVDGAIFNCHTTRRAVERLLKRKLPGIVAYPGRDRLIPAVSVEELTRRALGPGPLRIIFLANVVPNKGLNVLLDALNQLPLRSWHLTVAGSLTMNPAYVRTIRHQITRAGLSNHVEMIGAMPHDKVPELLARSHVLAVPSYYEAIGMAYLEAMGFGLPVIASRAGGAREIITHGEQGFLVAPGDANSIAGYLREIEQDRPRLIEMSRSASKRFSAHPTWEQSLGDIREFLQTLIRK